MGMERKIYTIENVTIPEALGELRLAAERKFFEQRRPHAARVIENEFAYV